MSGLTRRELLGTLAVGAGLATVAGFTGCAGTGALPEHRKGEFYGADGKFNAEAAKQAYFEMMEFHGYPIPPKLRADMWVSDFALGKFPEVGMGGIFWVNEKDGGYFGHEIYLLPHQMLVEHWHVKTDTPAKMEAWHLRHGTVTLFGEGDPTPGAEKLIPACEREFATVLHATPLVPGEYGKLNRAEAKHFMVGGLTGTIVTEYANYHDGAGLRFTDPSVKL